MKSKSKPYIFRSLRWIIKTTKRTNFTFRRWSEKCWRTGTSMRNIKNMFLSKYRLKYRHFSIKLIKSTMKRVSPAYSSTNVKITCWKIHIKWRIRNLMINNSSSNKKFLKPWCYMQIRICLILESKNRNKRP